MSKTLTAAVLLAALSARGGDARAQIWMSRGSDGSLHFTNVPARRRPEAERLVGRHSHERRAPNHSGQRQDAGAAPR